MPLEFTLYTKREVAEAIKEIGKVPAYTTLLKQADLNLTDVPTRECLAFEQSKNVYGEVDPAYGKVKEYTELEGEELPGSGLSARQMARVINFSKRMATIPCQIHRTWGTVNMQQCRGVHNSKEKLPACI